MDTVKNLGAAILCALCIAGPFLLDTFGVFKA